MKCEWLCVCVRECECECTGIWCQKGLQSSGNCTGLTQIHMEVAAFLNFHFNSVAKFVRQIFIMYSINIGMMKPHLSTRLVWHCQIGVRIPRWSVDRLYGTLYVTPTYLWPSTLYMYNYLWKWSNQLYSSFLYVCIWMCQALYHIWVVVFSWFFLAIKFYVMLLLLIYIIFICHQIRMKLKYMHSKYFGTFIDSESVGTSS